MDWDMIEDRSRTVQAVVTWDSPEELLATAADQFRLDLWATQPVRPEIIIEKDSLAGTIASVCRKWRVPLLPAHGYLSLSEAWDAGYWRYRDASPRPVVLCLYDHDPRGIHMPRDLEDKLALFAGEKVEVRRIALNLDQIEEFGLPPNPVKDTDKLTPAYVREFGLDTCWELDALSPRTLSALVEDSIVELINQDAWDEGLAREQEHAEAIRTACEEM